MKRNAHIVKLSKDHHFSLLFCWKIRNGLKYEVAPGRIIKYVEYFWQTHMQPHFADEETILFSAIKGAEVQKALIEHRQIAEQIKALSTAGNNEANRLSILADMVNNHVRYEERELFPYLEKVLTDEKLDSIGKQLNAHNDPALSDDFADNFWLKNKDGL